MQHVLLVIHLILAASIIIVVLLQRSEGGGFVGGSSGGLGAFMGTRSTANLLTRATAILAAAFFFTSLTLAIIAARQAPEPTLMDALDTATQTEAPAVPGETQTEEGSENGAPEVPVSE